MELDIIKLWKYPSPITQKIGWWVFTLSGENDYFIREIKFFSLESWGKIQERVQSGVWDKKILEECVRLATIPKPIFDNQLALLGQIAIPLWVSEHPSGDDGTDYGLEIFDFGTSRCKITWWSEGASEWKSLIQWWQATEVLFIDVLKN